MTHLDLMRLTARVSAIDPAGGKGGRTRQGLKHTRARQAIVTIAGDLLGRIFVLEAWADRTSTEKFVDRIFETHERWQPSAMGCEANAMQEIFGDTVMMIAKTRGVRLPLVPVYASSHIEKDARIRMILQPVLAYGRLFLQKDQEQLRQEIVTFPQGMTKDLIDALAAAILLLPAAPKEARRAKTEVDLRDYLRRAGTPEHQIQARLRQIREEDRWRTRPDDR